jgi:asparagine synthase (glutamine-hydrolysing)
MSGIFGIVRFDGGPADPERLAALATAMAPWGRHTVTTKVQGSAALGHALTLETPEDLHVAMPVHRTEPDLLLVSAEGRLDNRDDLLSALGIGAEEARTTADAAIMQRAYEAWGADCAERLLGDWSLAAWHAVDRRLALLRDHGGSTALYVHHDRATSSVLFASDARALHAAGVPHRLDELRLAQVLVSWHGGDRFRTIDLDVDRLPPGHTAAITPVGMSTRRYWFPEEVEPMRGPTLGEYAEGLRGLLDQAVRARLRSVGGVAVTLTGGLDSGAIAALAAPAARTAGIPLAAYTAVTAHEAQQCVGPEWIADEGSLASLTAARSGIVDHVLLDSARTSPLHGIWRTLATLDQPFHAASNAYWTQDLLSTASGRGDTTLLIGNGGNATISWTGRPVSTTLAGRWRADGVRGLVGYLLPVAVQRRRMAAALHAGGWPNSAISPGFAARVGLADLLGDAVGRDASVPQARADAIALRAAHTMPGLSRAGEYWAPLGAVAGIDVRDPAADPRVVEYAYAVPDALFTSPDGLDRMLVREATTGLLPDEVRLGTRRGWASADIVARLRDTAAQVDAAVAHAADGPAAEYVDVDALRRTWADAQRADDFATTHRAGALLLRGLAAALWLGHGATPGADTVARPAD